MKKNLIIYFICGLFAVVAGTSCDEESISMNAAKLPNETAMDNIAGVLRSASTLTTKVLVNLEEEDRTATEEIYYLLSRPAENALTVTVTADEKLVEDYNLTNGTNVAALPAGNVKLENGGVLSVAVGKQESAKIKFTISTEGLESDTPYLLPLVISQTPAGIQAQDAKQILYYAVNIRKKITVCPIDFGVLVEMPPMLPDALAVFYVNTAAYQPLIADVYGITRTSQTDFKQTLYTIGSIVNLKTVTVGYDPVTKRALLNLSSDMHNVLEQADKFIRPLQDHGRKVCICIQGGGNGLGFCNLTDAQVDDFVRQVKNVLDLYKLDGVNLWDEGNGYGKDGMPTMNTTSYPKLIKALREALPGKLLTLVDQGKPTEYFYDADKCGGIEVGKCIDYAWHNYASEEELVQIIEPWEVDHPYSEHTRKPIAGLTPERYGSLSVPFYYMIGSGEEYNKRLKDSDRRVIDWKTAKRKKNDLIVFGFDLTANEQTKYEGSVKYALGMYVGNMMNDGNKWEQSDFPPYEWGVMSSDYSYGYKALDYILDSGYRMYSKGWVRPEGW